MHNIDFAGGTDIGRLREKNEDSILLCGFEHSDVYLFAVADGVGGHKGGDVASQIAVDTIRESVQKAVLQASSGGGYSEHWLELSLEHAINNANRKILEQQQDPDLYNMATTIVAILIKDGMMAISYLGDSRCYKYSHSKLTQMTQDHTILNESGYQHVDENSSYSHLITRALGLSDGIEIEVECIPLISDTCYLLCSDGLTNCLSDQQINQLLNASYDLPECIDTLITYANDNGGIDNISAVLVRV